jgi:hypothetical protein
MAIEVPNLGLEPETIRLQTQYEFDGQEPAILVSQVRDKLSNML